MNKGINILALFTGIIAGWLGCKKVYQPKIVSPGSANYLVVEGVINTGADSSLLHLSRAVPISSKGTSIPETGAVISILSDAGVTYPVVEKGNGYYKGAIINSSAPARYSVRIFTADGKNYQSDFVQAKNSPPIDSVYYRVGTDGSTPGINIYADTHDPANNSRYYRWDYVDTYDYHSAFNSYEQYTSVPFDTVITRPLSEQIYVCYRNDTSSTVLINTSARLASDVITQNQVAFIPSISQRIGNRYSILVNQYALTPEAFSYYQQLKKNTEKIGSIFDPLPSELPGNIHCLTNASEPVIGYLTAGTLSQMRIFIDNRNLPAWETENPYAGCKTYSDLYNGFLPNGDRENQVADFIYTGTHIPITPIAPPGATKILGYQASEPACVDCRLAHGTNKRPDFWTDL